MLELSTVFWVVVAAVMVGGVAAKLASLLIDGLIWLKSFIVDVHVATIQKRNCKSVCVPVEQKSKK